MKEYPIGAVFKHCNKYYRVVPDEGISRFNCKQECALYLEPNGCVELMMYCNSNERKDETDVSYVRATKQEAVKYLLTGGR